MIIHIAGKDVDTSEFPSLEELGARTETLEAVEEILDVFGERLDPKTMSRLLVSAVLFVQTNSGLQK